MSMKKSFRVSHKVEPPYSVIVESTEIDESLLLESDVVAILGTSELDSLKKKYEKVIDAYGCLGILRLNTGDETVLYVVMVTGIISVGKIGASEVFRITATSFISLRNNQADEERVAEVRKLLNSGTFYFAWSALEETFDLSLCAQRQHQSHSTDNRFFWNRTLHLHLTRFNVDCSKWLIKAMCGGVEMKTIYCGTQLAKACIISRLSCERAGTRFNVRGTNDFGHVANFCETEQVIYLDDKVASYIQTRGSVPLYWEQPGLQVGSHKVKMSRGYEASAPAFDRHLSTLKVQYGDQVIINLLGNKEGEDMLSKLFQNHHKASSHSQDIPHIVFDYHQMMRGGKVDSLQKVLMPKVSKYVDSFQFFACDGDDVKMQQTGCFRVNCIDCLDRTNAVQTFFGMQMLQKQMESLDMSSKAQYQSRLEEVYKTMWSLNGDHVSKIYAGTGALEGRTTAGKLRDGARSVTRTIQNNFFDGSKQEAIDILLLGNSLVGKLADKAGNILPREYLHSSPSTLHAMCEREHQFSKQTPLRVSVGTWNVNGGRHFRSVAYKHQSMTDWLLDNHIIMQKKFPGQYAGKLRDGARSVTRTIQNNFFDGSKQEAIDILLLGNSLVGKLADKAGNILPREYLHSSPSTLHAMCEREHQFSKPTPLRVSVGTWNVNGGRHFRSVAYKHQSMTDWLLDNHIIMQKKFPGSVDSSVDFSVPVDVYAIGFEEMVDLNASNIISASDVAVDKVKTGLKGKSGNKGSVAIRFLLYNTSMCFVCAHFAAGQSQVKDRNEDYAEITKRIMFPMGRTLSSHDYVFWCGDFNYRIDIENEEVKSLVSSENWEALKSFDQLLLNYAEGKVFQGFAEGDIQFAPTYKYDLFSDDYDTSEKNRTPAWTDRVLWNRRRLPYQKHDEDSNEEDQWNPGRMLQYGRAELKTSDHRPVIALIEIVIQVVNEDDRDAIYKDILCQQGPTDGTIMIHLGIGGAEFSDNVVDEILRLLAQVGEVVLVRFVEASMVVTFRDGRSALAASGLNGHEVFGHDLVIELQQNDWLQQVEEEISLCTSNTERLYEPVSNSLLGESFDYPSMSFELDDEDIQFLASEENEGLTLQAPLVPELVSSRSSSPSVEDTSNGESQKPSRPSRPPPLSKTRPPRPGAPPERPKAPPERPKAPPKRPPSRPSLPVRPQSTTLVSNVPVNGSVPLSKPATGLVPPARPSASPVPPTVEPIKPARPTGGPSAPARPSSGPIAPPRPAGVPAAPPRPAAGPVLPERPTVSPVPSGVMTSVPTSPEPTLIPLEATSAVSKNENGPSVARSRPGSTSTKLKLNSLQRNEYNRPHSISTPFEFNHDIHATSEEEALALLQNLGMDVSKVEAGSSIPSSSASLPRNLGNLNKQPAVDGEKMLVDNKETEATRPTPQPVPRRPSSQPINNGLSQEVLENTAEEPPPIPPTRPKRASQRSKPTPTSILEPEVVSQTAPGVKPTEDVKDTNRPSRPAPPVPRARPSMNKKNSEDAALIKSFGPPPPVPAARRQDSTTDEKPDLIEQETPPPIPTARPRKKKIVKTESESNEKNVDGIDGGNVPPPLPTRPINVTVINKEEQDTIL
ncbi:synaptojanin-1-like [Anneissia japonica]|uniref:synaptojanin-1-like n=1 Tax=Anneissia japonica TaxID=1529436 RepID=UPI0014258712|nr:synaptojanin-1-like [Anneissia japonica]